MDVEQFLRLRDADIPTIVESARTTIGLEADDILLAVGSLAEGLGNVKSDLDLLLITDRRADSLPAREVPLVIGKCLSDVLVVRRPELGDLTKRLSNWASQVWTVSQVTDFSLEERRLLHRILHSTSVFPAQQLQGASFAPRLEELARLKLHVARHLSRTIQVDMVGNRNDGDFASLTFAAQELLGHAIDALAAGHLLTNPTPKWRSRLLRLLPADWERALGRRRSGMAAHDFFWRLHRAPETPDAAAVLGHAFPIASFARAVFAWAENRLLEEGRERDALARLSDAAIKSRGPSLPFLDIDVDFVQDDDRAYLARLNEFEEPLELSPAEFSLALMFDGTTTIREAQTRLQAAYPGIDAKATAVDFITRAKSAGLCVSPQDLQGRETSDRSS